ncbi:MAG: hypothetical protein OXH34_02145, partial [Bacteroidetes bacterium]|nr:hypothetical protein [Bacteroidota bacterium]
GDLVMFLGIAWLQRLIVVHVGDPIYVIDDTCTDFTECLVACEFDAIQPIPEDAADEITVFS